MARPLFPFFFGVVEKKDLVWFTVAIRLDIPHHSGGVNERNTIIDYHSLSLWSHTLYSQLSNCYSGTIQLSLSSLETVEYCRHSNAQHFSVQIYRGAYYTA